MPTRRKGTMSIAPIRLISDDQTRRILKKSRTDLEALFREMRLVPVGKIHGLWLYALDDVVALAGKAQSQRQRR
jgi:hypothetical protein